MKKSTRRILALALALSLALVCTLAISAFAASDFWIGECDSTTFEMLADIERCTVSTDVVTEYIYGFSICDIDMTYTYFPNPPGTDARTQNVSNHKTYYNSGSLGATREQSLSVDLGTGCFSMVAATFNYRVQLNSILEIYESPPYSIAY